MSMEVGQKVNGTITGIKPFGAFVAIGEDKSGLVHISEISNEYINDINQVLKLGDEVTVKILTIAPDGKISLSMRQANEEAEAATKPKPRKEFQAKDSGQATKPFNKGPKKEENFHSIHPTVPKGDNNYGYANQNVTGKYAQRNNDDFDKLMSNFLKDSEDRLFSLKRSTEAKRGGRGGRRG